MQRSKPIHEHSNKNPEKRSETKKKPAAENIITVSVLGRMHIADNLVFA